jgi:UDP-glucuronate 4-epimerase
MSETILVTGASGFVGLNIVEALLARGDHVVALSHDALPAVAAAAFARLPGRLEAITADIATPRLLGETIRAHGIGAAIHLAAITYGAQQDLRGTSRVLDVNAIGTLAMFEAAVAHRLRRVVYASSTAVYGEAPLHEATLDEDTAPRPFTLYGITKLLGERMMDHFRALHGLDDCNDIEPERRCKLEVAVVVGRHGHDRTRAVRREHVVGHPHRHGLARERMDHR